MITDRAPTLRLRPFTSLMTPLIAHFALVLPLCAALFAVLPAHAAPFEIALSPSRLEIDAKSGERIGRTLDVYNVGSTPTAVSVRTLDWSYSDTGNVTYFDALQPGSCRPWVTLERKAITIDARSKSGFRIQIDVPPGTPKGECRLMLAFEGVEPAYQAAIAQGGMNLSLPVNGRIAVALYLLVGGAQPQLEVGALTMREINGQKTAVLSVTNTGDAHGRIEGTLEAKDAQGRSFEMIPESTPVMPGQTRALPLSVKADSIPAGMTAPVFPVRISGTLDWERGAFKLDAELK